MNLRNFVSASLAAISLVAVPVAAQAATANTAAVSKLSVRAAPAVRQGARIGKASKLEGATVVIVLIATAAAVAGIVIAADGSNNARSPS